MHAWM